jgi:hypothetical protein
MPTVRSPLEDRVATVRTRGDFAAFVSELARDAQAHPEQWENASLHAYLAALGAWAEDLDGYYRNLGQPTPDEPSWGMLASMLLAARVYE